MNAIEETLDETITADQSHLSALMKAAQESELILQASEIGHELSAFTTLTSFQKADLAHAHSSYVPVDSNATSKDASVDISNEERVVTPKDSFVDIANEERVVTPKDASTPNRLFLNEIKDLNQIPIRQRKCKKPRSGPVKLCFISSDIERYKTKCARRVTLIKKVDYNFGKLKFRIRSIQDQLFLLITFRF
jgi:hypothetical protein